MEEVNYYLRRLDSNGLLSRWFTEAAANATKCNTLTKMLRSHGRRNTILGLVDVRTVFFMALIGVGLALKAFAAETLLGRRVQKPFKNAKSVDPKRVVNQHVTPKIMI